MSRRIKKVVVLGLGVMGFGIVCYFVNIGLEVFMLDIVFFDFKEEEKVIFVVCNWIVNGVLKVVLKVKLVVLYDKFFVFCIIIGNFDDDFEKIVDVDWVIEVVIERFDIKK